jgi:hypothetical protein
VIAGCETLPPLCRLAQDTHAGGLVSPLRGGCMLVSRIARNQPVSGILPTFVRERGGEERGRGACANCVRSAIALQRERELHFAVARPCGPAGRRA